MVTDPSLEAPSEVFKAGNVHHASVDAFKNLAKKDGVVEDFSDSEVELLVRDLPPVGIPSPIVMATPPPTDSLTVLRNSHRCSTASTPTVVSLSCRYPPKTCSPDEAKDFDGDFLYPFNFDMRFWIFWPVDQMPNYVNMVSTISR